MGLVINQSLGTFQQPLACVADGIRERASSGGVAIPSRGNSRAAKPRVKFPPATFHMVFACRPLLSILMNQLTKCNMKLEVYFCPKERKLNKHIACDSSEIEYRVFLEKFSDNSRHKYFSRQAYGFLEVKLRRLRRKRYEGKYDTRD